MTSGRLFILGLLAFGVAARPSVVATVPAARSLPVPSIAWPLVASLLADLALMPLVKEGRVAPITMNERAVGVIGAAIVIAAFAALAPA